MVEQAHIWQKPPPELPHDLQSPDLNRPSFPGNTTRSRLPLAFGASSPSQCFGGVNMRGFQGSPLVVVRKGLKLIRNRLVGHSSGDAQKSLRCLQILFASL
jgi:hypothetical protein